jgi:CheY-like chemotaxis protein
MDHRTLNEQADLNGLRVLVVEDEPAISMLIEDMLEDLGCKVAGVANTVASALALIQAGPADAAVLDVNLGRESIFPVADELTARGVPFLFSTGYGSAGIRPADRERPVLPKPFTQADLERGLRRALAR